MRLKMLVGMAGPDISLSPGDHHECSDAAAIRLIEAGFAVPVSEPKIERAVKSVPEKRKK